jgi:AraC family transcriptional regulator
MKTLQVVSQGNNRPRSVLLYEGDGQNSPNRIQVQQPDEDCVSSCIGRTGLMNDNLATLSRVSGPQTPKTWNRILVYRDRRLQPFLPLQPVGVPSPSPSLLVERFDLATSHVQTHSHVDQILSLHLKPNHVLYEVENHGFRKIQFSCGQVGICGRHTTKTLHLKSWASFLCVRVSDLALEDASRFLADKDRPQLCPTTSTEDARMTSLLYAVELERARGFESGRLFLDSVEAALASLLILKWSDSSLRSATKRKGGLAPHLLRRALDFMHANLHRQIGLQNLADSTGLSVSHFSHQFRQSIGISPYRHMQTLRIEHSKRLLKNQKSSVLDVALAVGFENQQHFATVFRRLVGHSPSAYRRLL